VESNFLNDESTLSLEVKNPMISIVIPTLNEAKSIKEILLELNEVLKNYDYSLLVVDGRSKDGTDQIALNNGAEVIYQQNRGYGDALQTGFFYAKEHLGADIIVVLDADLTYDPRDIPSLIDPILRNEADLMIGNRFVNMEAKAMTRLNQLGNRFLSWVARRFLRIKINDTQCGLRAFWSGLIDRIDLESDGMPFAIEMIAKAKFTGVRIGEVPVNYRKRVGITKLNPLRDGIRIFVTMVRLVRDTRPFLFFGGIGIVLGLAGVWAGLDVTFEWFRTHTIVRLPTVMLSVLLLIGAMQFFTIGLVADMLKHRMRKKGIIRIGYNEKNMKKNE
jgi:dolichol-phosphate mannosyltransferase